MQKEKDAGGLRKKTIKWHKNGKIDFQITPSTRLNGFVQYDNKDKWGRAWYGYTVQGSETLWNQTGPGYFWKGQIEQMFGNLYIDAKYIFINGGFNLQPVQGKHTADGFNITNSAHALKQEARMDADNFLQDLRILNPRIFRFSVRFNF